MRAIAQPIALSILYAVDRYLVEGQGDVKRLRGVEPPELRLRFGDYRVRFYDYGDSIQVLRVKHRKDAYR